MHKATVGALLAASVLAGGVVLASPAQAAGSCVGPIKNDFNVTIPGPRPDLTFYIKNCANVIDNEVTGYSLTSWGPIDPQGRLEDKRFTSFVITTRIEAREGVPAPFNKDKVITSKSCDLTALVNKHVEFVGREDDFEDPVSRCVAPAATFDNNLWWSADSTITYDIEGDSQGTITQQVNGSPLLN
ncbi:hypothetical protein C9F11_21280 [Streptomyces sp. YIM 121038]|uniref:hypothetical protein n=1 Tax=Streptomyces sp. YIM 121038 TaxID=2136401 RepID=UPI001110AE30|nr:hypothetical protein [Streptomyces sp. YIM 121038]QCX77888.1 hypothetical protein C9F11_21280 [Streptomyces sp. YIM 121038]